MAEPLFRLAISMPGVSIVATRRELSRVLRAAGSEVAARARSLIRARRIGGKKHVSAPGAPPVSRSGVLASSIRVRLARGGRSVSIIDAAASKNAAYYALFLEKGAKGGGGATRGHTHLARTGSGVRRMDKSAVNRTRVLLPHPFLSRALEDVAGAGLGDRVARAVMDGVKLERRKLAKP